MCRVRDSRRLPVLMLFALLSCGSVLLCAQSQVQEVNNVTTPQPLQPAQIQATPEEIGDAYLARREYQQAITAYASAPRTAVVWNKTGVAYESMLDLNDAMRCFKASLRLNHRDAQVINNIATVYDAMKKYRKAYHLYHKALKIAPDSPLIWKNLGTNLMARRKYRKGWEAYSKALALDPHVLDSPGVSDVQNTATLEQRGAMNYYMAKSCVQAGLAERAVQFLRMALSEGFTTRKKVAEDESFAPLRALPAYQKLIAEERSQ